MITKVVPGILIATPDAAQAAGEAAGRIARAIRTAQRDRGRAMIALSGGNSPRETYERLAEADRIDWGKVEVFFVDERCVPPDSARSNYKMVSESLVARARLAPSNVYRMEGESSNLEAAARKYEETLAARVAGRPPVFDLVMLGVGDDGHTASLFPGAPELDITDRYVVGVSARDGREARITMTFPLLEAARNVLVLALGRGKHEPLERAWAASGSLSETPARIVRSARGSVTWVIDRAAGGL